MLFDTLYKTAIRVDTHDTKLDSRDTTRAILYLYESALFQSVSACIKINPTVGYTQWPHVPGVALKDTLRTL